MRITLADAVAKSCMPLTKLPHDLPESIDVLELLENDFAMYPLHLRVIHVFLHLPRRWQREMLSRFALEVTKDIQGQEREQVEAVAEYVRGLGGGFPDETITLQEFRRLAFALRDDKNDDIKCAGINLLSGLEAPHLSVGSPRAAIAASVIRSVIQDGNL